MQTNGGGLLKLPDEILLRIISFYGVNVADILNLGRTCKRLNRLCHEKPAWLAMLQSLDINEAPNLPPFMSADMLSHTDLEHIVVSAVSRERARQSSGPIHPTGLTELQVGLINKEPTGVEEFLPRLDPRLLPGGKYVLLDDNGTLQLWSVEGKEHIWTADFDRDVTCMAFDSEVVDEGQTVMIGGMFIDKERDEAVVRIYSVELASGHEELKIERSIPSVFVFRIMLRGDLLMIHLPHALQVILVDWRHQRSVIVDYADSMSQRANARACVIVKDHIVVLLYVGAVTMIALPISVLESRWSSSLLIEEWSIVVVHPNGRIADEVGELQDAGCTLELSSFGIEDGPWVLALHGFVPTWKGPEAPAEIHLVGYGRSFDPQWTKKLLTYRIQLSSVRSKPQPSTDEPRTLKDALRFCKSLGDETVSATREVECGGWKLSVLEQTSAPASTVPWNPNCIANSGHIITTHDQSYCFKLFDQGEQPHSVVELGVEITPGMEPTLASVEPWSGSVVIGTPGLVRIIRFD